MSWITFRKAKCPILKKIRTIFNTISIIQTNSWIIKIYIRIFLTNTPRFPTNNTIFPNPSINSSRISLTITIIWTIYHPTNIHHKNKYTYYISTLSMILIYWTWLYILYITFHILYHHLLFFIILSSLFWQYFWYTFF